MTAPAYLDWNASAPLHDKARDAMLSALDEAGNPSSVHSHGRAARRLVEEARQSVAALLGARPADVVFTSGGTEANNLALTPAIMVNDDRAPCGRLLVSAIEHPSVLSGHRFPDDLVEAIPVTADGLADLDSLRDRLSALAAQGVNKPLVSLMAANNETGVVQPVAQAAAIVREAGGLFHVDATQAPGRIPCRISDLAADLLTISAHKLGGPKGVGALVRRSDAIHVEPLIKGGGQERGQRGGTENVAAIAGFGAAAEIARREGAKEAKAATVLRDRLEADIQRISPQAVIFGAQAPRLPNTCLFAVPGGKAETLVIAFDLAGVSVSSGSACSSGKVAASHVLAAMGVAPDLARGAIRVSLGATTTIADIDAFAGAWTKLAERLSKGGSGGLAA